MGFIIKWAGGTAYVGDTGRVEGADGNIWPIGKPLWMLKRMLKHRELAYTIEERELSLVEQPKKRGRSKKIQMKEPKVIQLKEPEEPLAKEPVECKS